MKKHVFALLAVGAAILLAACEYDAPLSPDHALPVDPALLGAWVLQPEAEDHEAVPERMTVLKFSPTEYVVHYQNSPTSSSYYRGYPIRVGDIACVQLEALGTESGAVTEPRRFLVSNYTIIEGRLAVRLLNDDVVSTDLEGTDAIRKAFLQNASNSKLFRDPGVFVRPASEPSPASGAGG